MNLRIKIWRRWYGEVPTKNGKPLPKTQWVRAGRRRKWSVRWYSPDGTRPRKTFDTQEEAEEYARKLNSESESKGPQARTRPRKVALGAFADEFPKLGVGPRGERLALRSVHEYRAVLDRFAKFIGRRTLLEQVTSADAQRYLAHLRETPSRRKKPLSTASLNKHKRSLKAVFNVAVRQLHYLNFSPLSDLREDRSPSKKLRYVSPTEFQRLIDAAQTLPNCGLWLEAFLQLAYTSGARSGELVHLSWSDIDFEKDEMRICAKPEENGLEAWQPKDYDSRVIPLPRRTMEVLARWHALADDGSTFVFLSPQRVAWIKLQRETGKWKPGRAVLNNLTRDFETLVRRAAIAHASLHDLRRACITHWARKLPAPVVKELAGHADIKTTIKHYVALQPGDLAAARDVTAAALLPTSEAAA